VFGPLLRPCRYCAFAYAEGSIFSK